MKKVLLLIKISTSRLKKNLHLVQTAEQLIEVFKLRSNIYTRVNYETECPDLIEGLNFDMYDKNSAILFYESNNEIRATGRLIFDTKSVLPTEEKLSFAHIRKEHQNISEISRLVIKGESKGLSLEFKYITQGFYSVMLKNNIQLALLSIKEEHYKLYSKFGGSKIIQKLSNYGHVDLPFLIMSLDPSQPSKFFTKAFLT